MVDVENVENKTSIKALSNKNKKDINTISGIKRLKKTKINIKAIEKDLMDLVELDYKIFGYYEVIEDSKWGDIQNFKTIKNLNVEENDELVTVQNTISQFITKFKYLKNIFDNFLTVEVILKLLEKHVFLFETKIVQFLMFNIAQKNHRQIFGYLFNKLVNDQYRKQYVPFYCSLLVRINIDLEFKITYFDYFYKYTKKSFTSLNVQYFIYCMCFLRIEKFLDFSKSLFYKYLNKIDSSVCKTFSEVFNIKYKINSLTIIDRHYNNSNICCYPFDEPVIYDVKNIFENDFIKFEL